MILGADGYFLVMDFAMRSVILYLSLMDTGGMTINWQEMSRSLLWGLWRGFWGSVKLFKRIGIIWLQNLWPQWWALILEIWEERIGKGWGMWCCKVLYAKINQDKQISSYWYKNEKRTNRSSFSWFFYNHIAQTATDYPNPFNTLWDFDPKERETRQNELSRKAFLNYSIIIYWCQAIWRKKGKSTQSNPKLHCI